MTSCTHHLRWGRWLNSRKVIWVPEALKRNKHHDRGSQSRRREPEELRAPRGARRGIQTRPPQVVRSAKFPQLVADDAEGLTQVQIAEKYGLHVQTVRKRLIAAGVDTHISLRALSDEELRAARVATGERASVREIARGLGIAHTTVTRSLTRRHEAPESPSRTTPTRPGTSPTPVWARRSPLRTTSTTPSDLGKREQQASPSIEMLGLDRGVDDGT